MIKKVLLLSTAICSVLLSACGSTSEKLRTDTPLAAESSPASNPGQKPAAVKETEILLSNTEEDKEMKLLIGEQEVPVHWEANESIEALKELVGDGPLSISLSMYGGFEQVGSFGTDLPRNDKQTTTSAGDIVLYSGNQIVLFYGSNSWSYTRLGHVDLTAAEMSELLSHGDVNITLSVE